MGFDIKLSGKKNLSMPAVLDRIPTNLQLPIDLMAGMPWWREVSAETTLNLVVPEDYEMKMQAAFGQSEVIGIQNLLTLARRGVRFQVTWHAGVAQKVTSSASIFPFLAVLLLLRNASHMAILADSSLAEMPIAQIRRAILRHRFA